MEWKTNFDRASEYSGDQSLKSHNLGFYHICNDPFGTNSHPSYTVPYDPNTFPSYDTNPTFADLYGPYPEDAWTEPGNPDLTDSSPDGRDSDGDEMADDWDDNPLEYRDRADTWVSIESLEYNGTSYPPAPSAPGPNPADPDVGIIFSDWSASPIVEKGDSYVLSVLMGFENGAGTGWNLPHLNLTFRFVPIWDGDDSGAIGDNTEPVPDGDWDYTNSSTTPAMPWKKITDNVGSRSYRDDIEAVTSGNPVAIGSGSSTMTFYKQVFTVYTPASIPAGIMSIEASVNTEGNIYYEDPAYTYNVA
jgi:hypothetical protein